LFFSLFSFSFCRKTCSRALFALSIAVTSGAAIGGESGKKADDHDIALGALARQEILPLETVLSRVRKTISGDVVGIELAQNDGVWVYELKVIGPGNNMVEAFIDARTAEVIETRGK
jgi:uncharacterized membrane protein YkoI